MYSMEGVNLILIINIYKKEKWKVTYWFNFFNKSKLFLV